MITYEKYNPAQTLPDGFFEGWPNPPSKERHRELLKKSYLSLVALNGNTIVGFLYVISDGVLSCYIPLLEVLPPYRNKGIGKALMGAALEELKDFYMVDLSCDDNLKPFYKSLGLKETTAMMHRNYDKQNGK